MNAGDVFLFYIALGIILLALAVIALPILMEQRHKKSPK